MKNLIKLLLNLIFSLFFFLPAYFAALIFRRKKNSGIKVLWGPTPLKNIHYNSAALNLRGIESHTLVEGLYRNNSRTDFDFYTDKFKSNFLNCVFSKYLSFFKILKNYDILITNFDGGFLRGTPLRFYEHIFWKAGRKSVIVWPYGSDSFVYSKMKDFSFRNGLIKSYPVASKNDNRTRKQIDYLTRKTDFIVGNIPHNESCPKWDILTIACYGIDTEEWKPHGDYSYLKSDDEPIVVLHCPNHRDVKGTNFLIEACSGLKNEGYKIELQILEHIPYDELMRNLQKCDIVASQFLYGYATNEIEGMSLAKPVLSNLESDYFYKAARRYTHFTDCPILSTSPENLKENLIKLIKNPELRKQLGKQGRDYVLKYHSLEAQGLMWTKIINKIRNKSDENLDDWWKERKNIEVQI